MIEDWSEWKWKLNKLKWQGKNSESEKKKTWKRIGVLVSVGRQEKCHCNCITGVFWWIAQFGPYTTF